VIALSAALVAAAHAYVLPWGILFLLPSNREKACAISSLHFGPPDGKWERAWQQEKRVSCEFRQFVVPGPLLPIWAEPAEMDEVSVTYTVQGSDEPQTVSLHAEKIDPAQLTMARHLNSDYAHRLSATVEKVKDNVRAVVTSTAAHPLLLGDAIAARNKPEDSCVGPGPVAVLEAGDALVDIRPGLLSKSMDVWVAAFTGPRRCTWLRVATRHK
jgi:hypothetical protein